MIERPDTDCPSLNTVTSARNPPAHCTNLAAARACRPRLLVISSTRRAVIGAIPPPGGDTTRIRPPCQRSEPPRTPDRKSVVTGKSVPERVDRGGRRPLQHKKTKK